MALVHRFIGLIAVMIVEESVKGFRFYGAVDGLSMEYYAMRCPMAEITVRNTVNRAVDSDATLAAGLLRMHFHDCFIEGCDGSILIDSTKDNKAEKDSPANVNLRGYEIIDDAKKELEVRCPGVVSCADILAMAARDAVIWAGGPFYDIAKGRKDGRRSKIEDTINLLSPTHNISELIRGFTRRGFNVQEMVALSGGHTLGVAKCSSFKNRLSKFDSTNDIDPTLDEDFAKTLTGKCSAGDGEEVAFDETRNEFDNAYFSTLWRNSGLLSSDQTLFTSSQTKGFVNMYTANQAIFFNHFSQAMVKMSTIDVKEGSKGEVRENCRKIT
ncbi:hypothetical protein Sjap_020295 [Stephania japonica]|uniref:Peroxidase n=1 Tax=Stephania japonica TaxID=461633 RepID=A0AAP0F0F3_9MAGN